MPRKKKTKTQRRAAARKSKAHALWLKNGKPSLAKLSDLSGVSKTTLSGWRKDWVDAEQQGNAAGPTVEPESSLRPEPIPSVLDPDADTISNLTKLRGAALEGLEHVLVDKSTPPGTRLSAARHALSLSGVVPPKRGSMQPSEQCSACENRAIVRKHIKGWSVDDLEQLEELLLRVTSGG